MTRGSDDLLSEEGQLLRQYAATRSDEAFARLVDRYVNVVHAAARRQVGDADLARDVTQAVFMILAEKAAELRDDRPLSAWLFQVTRYAAANAIRARARRARHEQRAAEMASKTSDQHDRSDAQWQTLAPLLDEGISRLRSKDRDVLLLRYFEQKTAREVAEAMGISEDAAEKRIARAVGKLRDFFQRRGVAVSLAVLGATLATHSAEAAPVGIAASIAASASGSSAATIAAGSIAKGTVITMATAKTKMIAAAALGLLLVGGGAVVVTTMMSSPRQRRSVVVTPSPAAVQPAALASPVPAGTIKGATISFSEGTTVELIGVSDAPTDNTRWWAADGTPITPPAKRPGAGLRGGEPSFQFLLRKVDGLNGAEMMVQLRGATISGAASTEQNINGERLHCDMFTLRDSSPPPMIDVAVSLAAGPWLPEQRWPLPPVTPATSAKSPSASAVASAPATTNPAPAPASDIVINDVRDAGKGITEVDLRFSPDIQRDRRAFDQQFYLVDAAGRQFFSQSWTGYPFGRNVVQFHAPRAQVIALVYRRRPYETREFRNVSLVPGQKTIVAISDVVPR